MKVRLYREDDPAAYGVFVSVRTLSIYLRLTTIEVTW